ncbi:response regulator transcription factor [Cytobacillus purgationiresistens]|uniref:DNA-binding response OmpR family regulator n=1 Tax=Cytobacillus purgationiresistens TaxID=863449 RepID=A0ABU0AEQ7_9BACI|nr:response regulator transcription factor [Cytobacillus purgationiresistens]MDQ0269344.1 DNA-binding response OmpR family regulator [Cytobacillus purgationiresistens]
MAKETILLVDDDQDIQEIQKIYLEKEGFQLVFAGDGQTAIMLTEQVKPDLIILDVNLPDMDGFEVCQSLRRLTNVPILFLSGREDDSEQILGHRIGGDDYITKPFSPGVLVAKVKAHIRRYRDLTIHAGTVDIAADPKRLTFGNIRIEKEECVVKKNGVPLSLSTKEFLLLCFFAEHPNRVFSLDQIFNRIWGEDSLGDNRTVMVHISNLRKKIEADPAKPAFILTVRGLGYKFSI